MNERRKNELRSSYRKPDFNGKNRRQTVEMLYYDNPDMMELFKVSDRTLQRWRDEGVLPFKKIRGKIYYLKQKIDELMESEDRPEDDQE